MSQAIVPVTVPTERWERLRARGLHVDFPVFLAPMVGLSHTALRQTVAGYLPDGRSSLLFTEMLSSRRLPTERIGDRPETAFATHETLVPQLLANEERFIAASLGKLERMRPAAVDINMGCPVSKALKHNWGVALMGDPAYAEEVVRLTVRHSPWPVTVKLRTGLSDDPQYLVDFARMLEQAGAAWLTIHPRIAAQQRRGRARWEYLARVREAVSIPVVGNGDVQTVDDALTLLRETGCDGVMIGRAAAARPWIFWQIATALGQPAPAARDSERPPSDGFAEGAEYARAMAAFIDVCERSFTPADAIKRLKFFVHWGGRWLDFGHELWRRMTNVSALDEARAVAQDFFAVPQRMTARTTLAS